MTQVNKLNEFHYKLLTPSRLQYEMQMKCLEDLLPSDHKARAVWEFVEKMDIASCLEEILTYKDAAGRPTTSPKVLLCLWIYSILDGNISARKLEELCKYHDAYKWIAGYTPINRTMLSDFRSKQVQKFDELLISCLAVMVESEVLSDEDFAQDGTKVKANAGTGSARREKSLNELKNEMKEYVKQLELEHARDPKAYDARTQAAKARAAREKSERIDKALKNLEESRARKIAEGKKTRQTPTQKELEDVRVSTTDPECRKMKMGDAGYRLAYNIQFATGLKSRVIFATDIVNTLDPGTSTPMMIKVHAILETLMMSPAKTWNSDSAYSGKSDVESADNNFPECKYYSPAKLKKGIDPKVDQKNDTEAVKNWRKTLDTEEMKETYQHRCSTAEFSNAQTKNHGMTEFLVRGFRKVNAMANLHAIAHNISRYWDLISKVEAEVVV